MKGVAKMRTHVEHNQDEQWSTILASSSVMQTLGEQLMLWWHQLYAINPLWNQIQLRRLPFPQPVLPLGQPSWPQYGILNQSQHGLDNQFQYGSGSRYQYGPWD